MNHLKQHIIHQFWYHTSEYDLQIDTHIAQTVGLWI